MLARTRPGGWCGASMSLTDHLATTLRLDLSRSRWFALAPVEHVARCHNGIGPEWMPR